MSNESVVVIILRLAGFYIGVTALWWLVRISASSIVVAGDGATFIAGAWAIGSLIVIGFAWFLIRFPRLITRRLLARKEAEEAAGSWSLDDFQSVLFAVLGLFFIVEGAVRAFSYIAGMLVALTDAGMATPLLTLGDLLGEILRVAAGIWLLFGARGLREVIGRVRRAGTGA